MTKTVLGVNPPDSDSADSIIYIDNGAVFKILSQSQEWSSQYGLELYPFRIGKYNEKVSQEYRLHYHNDTLAFIALSEPAMFEKAFIPFLFDEIDSIKNNSMLDPLDQCMRKCFSSLQNKIKTRFEKDVHVIHDFELQMPSRRPKILLQTAAHVSGAAFYYKRLDLFKSHLLGVCIHPKFGGWFGIRGVFIFPNVRAANFLEYKPIDVLPDDDSLRELLCLFNDEWQSGRYRDIIPVEDRYSDLQIEYFKHKPKDRILFIKRNILKGSF